MDARCREVILVDCGEDPALALIAEEARAAAASATTEREHVQALAQFVLVYFGSAVEAGTVEAILLDRRVAQGSDVIPLSQLHGLGLCRHRRALRRRRRGVRRREGGLS